MMIKIMLNLSNKLIAVSCPECHSKENVSMNQVANQESIVCSSCNQKIKLVDKGGSTKKAVTNINFALENFEKTIKSFNRKN